MEIAARDATPLNPRSHTTNFPSHLSQMGSPQLNCYMDPATQISDPLNLLYPRQNQGQLISGSGHHQIRGLQQGDQRPRDAVAAASQVQDPFRAHFDKRNAVMPNLQALRSNATMSDEVNNLFMRAYEGRVHSDIQQGKQQPTKRSGRYNTHDTISRQPHLRWPNEGFHVSNGKKRLHMTNCLSPSGWQANSPTFMRYLKTSL